MKKPPSQKAAVNMVFALMKQHKRVREKISAEQRCEMTKLLEDFRKRGMKEEDLDNILMLSMLKTLPVNAMVVAMAPNSDPELALPVPGNKVVH